MNTILQALGNSAQTVLSIFLFALVWYLSRHLIENADFRFIDRWKWKFRRWRNRR